MNNNTRYLRVTIHDNDFSSSLMRVGGLLYESFQFYEKYPTEKDFLALKEAIKHLWLSIHRMQDLIRWGNLNNCTDMEYFNPHLEFVDVTDIPDWDNAESIYIPMFNDGEILWM